MERVLGIDTHPDHDDARTEIIDLAIQPWLASRAVSAVELTVGGVQRKRDDRRRRA